MEVLFHFIRRTCHIASKENRSGEFERFVRYYIDRHNFLMTESAQVKIRTAFLSGRNAGMNVGIQWNPLFLKISYDKTLS